MVPGFSQPSNQQDFLRRAVREQDSFLLVCESGPVHSLAGNQQVQKQQLIDDESRVRGIPVSSEYLLLSADLSLEQVTPTSQSVSTSQTAVSSQFHRLHPPSSIIIVESERLCPWEDRLFVRGCESVREEEEVKYQV